MREADRTETQPGFGDRLARDPRQIVVVIENEPRIARTLRLLIEDWGFECIAGSSAAWAARELGVDASRVCAVIADYHLDDGFTGHKAAAMISLAAGVAVPTLLTTGHVMLADRQTGYPVLPKPFDPEVLRRWLEDNVCRRSDLARS
jgi:DNA-binding response OmpR family regulator